MIEIDRNSKKPLVDQLADQLRFAIAAARYKTGDLLPSTRELADQTGVSFHTVRKAYAMLESENILSVKTGLGYRVLPAPVATAEAKMEKGATIVQETLQRLIGLGFGEADIEFLLEEQMTYLERPSSDRKIMFCATYMEMAETCANQLTRVLQEEVEPVVLRFLGRHPDADYILAPFILMQSVLLAAPRAEHLGMTVYHPPATLQRVAELLPTQTLGIVTRTGEAVPHVISQVKHETGFGGQIIAASTDIQRKDTERLLSSANLVIYTPQARRTVRSLFPETPTYPWSAILGSESLASVRSIIP